MSESNEHRNLVLTMADALQQRYPGLQIETDIQERPGDPVPQIIDGYRPDIYAYHKIENLSIICEAKTLGDLINNHTISQVKAFTRHLATKIRGQFLLGVYGQGADEAKTLLQQMYIWHPVDNCQLYVFDSLDYWELNVTGGVSWRLI